MGQCSLFLFVVCAAVRVKEFVFVADPLAEDAAKQKDHRVKADYLAYLYIIFCMSNANFLLFFFLSAMNKCLYLPAYRIDSCDSFVAINIAEAP